MRWRDALPSTPAAQLQKKGEAAAWGQPGALTFRGWTGKAYRAPAGEVGAARSMEKGNRPHAVASGARGRPERLGCVLPALPCGSRLAAAGQHHRAPAPPRVPVAVLPLLRASPRGLSQCTSCSPGQKPRASAGRPPTDRPASPRQAALLSRQTVRGEGCRASGGYLDSSTFSGDSSDWKP